MWLEKVKRVNLPSVKRFLLWMPLSCLVVLIDQLSKHIALTHLVYATPKVILPFLNLTLIYNTGVSFGFLHKALGEWQQFFLIAMTATISTFILIWLYRVPAKERLTAFSLALIFGGAVGNLIDRVRFAYVVDFLNFHIGAWHFAVFNLADAAISIGAALIILGIFLERRDPA